VGNDPAVWTALPARLRWLTAGTIAAAAFRLGVGTSSLPDVETLTWFLGLLLASSVGATFKVHLPLPGGGSTMSLSYIVDFAALLIVGPDLACVAAAISTWSQTTLRVARRNPPYRVLFSMAAVIVATAGAGTVYALAGGSRGAPLLTFAVAVTAATSTYFVLTTGLVALAVAWSRDEPPYEVWHANFLWTAPSYFLGSCIAAGGVLAIAHVNVLVLGLAIAVPALLTYRSYHVYFGRLADEQRQVQEVSELHLATVEALAAAIDAKDNAFTQHVRRVERLAERLARALGMSEPEIRGVKTAALLHDIGKLAVPEYILSKPGPLTPEEFARVQAHPRVGAEIISNVPFPYPVVPLVRSHHERWDGGGYPDGLAGDAIPLGARLISVVDYFDALTCDRPYRRALPEAVALEMMRAEAGRALDPRVVETFISLVPELSAEGVLAVPTRSAPRHPGGGGPGGSRSPAEAVPEEPHVFDDIAHAHRELYVLYEIAQSMGRSLGVADTFALIASRLGALVPYSSCALFLLEADAIAGAEASGTDADRLRRLRIPIGEGNVGWAVRERRALLNGEGALDLAAGGDEADTRLKTALVTPLVFNDECIGGLAVYHTDAEAFRPEHQRFLERVSEQAAAVIYHSILFERTREDSLTDPITRLPNARFLRMHASTELARARRSRHPLSLIVFDLDDFKSINDEHGHPVGDAALRGVGQLLSRALRPYDVCARYAGDEFVIVLADCAAEEAEAKRRELQQQADAAPLDLGVLRRTIRLSAGCATFPEDGDDYEALLARADQRMYQDKSLRRRPGRGAATRAVVSADAVPEPVGNWDVA
jgi:diguanylate cyclase (GGDEF)-like protein/putative nucleotidyltransferase with HDIG domain